MTDTDFITRRSEAETRLEILRQKRGAAALDGKPFDAAEIDALENELDSLTEAEGEQARRERAQAEAGRQARLTELRKQLAVLELTRLGAVQDANVAARTLVESITVILDTNRQMAEIAHAITGGPVPAVLVAPEVASRLSGRLSAIMQTISGHPARFGAIEWRGGSLYKPSDNWREREAALLEPHLKPLIERNHQMPKTELEKAKPASAAEREVPEVSHENVTINDAGVVFRNVLARMPEGLVSDDLRNPKIWRRVQLSAQTALIKLDRLFLLGHDESWAAEAIVKRATGAEASLAILKVFSFREADETLFNDGTLEVYWDGAAYAVRRMSDGVRVVSPGYTTEALAADALRKTYPTKAA